MVLLAGQTFQVVLYHSEGQPGLSPALELEGQALGEVLCPHSGRIQGLNESQSLLQNRGWQADRLGQIR